MTNHIDAVTVSDQIKKTYRRYLKSLISVRDSKLNAAIIREIHDTKLLDKGPYLEATPPYKPGSTLRSLINEGVLSQSFRDITSEHLPLDRPLYVHQEKSIRKVSAGRNVIVATGTGSGKTESFLLPILDTLTKEKEAGTLGPGVRALLLYPMNALANDQLKRLRKLLANYPEITFGRYTGDTQDDNGKAIDMFKELNIGEPILDNELLSRQVMRSTPPNILLTNYAMLEYLLLRPEDTTLFSSNEHNWKFIVVDEAHVYDGSQGAEIAMLLRRLKDRVSPDKTVQCIATSATVGSQQKASSITDFASKLFGQKFEWSDDDINRQDLITSERVSSVLDNIWGPLSAENYIEIATSLDIEDTLINIANKLSDSKIHDPYTAITHEAAFIKAHDLLSKEPKSVVDAADKIFNGQQDALEGLKALITIGSSIQSTDGTPAISARYHLFLRATEGAYACFSPSGPHIQFARHEKCPKCDYSMFEIGACKSCGAVHTIGHIEEFNKLRHFMPRTTFGENTWLVFTDDASINDEDEDTITEYNIEGDEAKLCIKCNAVSDIKTEKCPDCTSTNLRKVRKLKKKGEEIAGCLVCGARGAATVRIFETGAEATGAVIATSLYQNLPIEAKNADLPGGGRKLLAFSDSRQSAAYFAPYIESSYSALQRRRLMVKGLTESKYSDEPVETEDMVHYVMQLADKINYFRDRPSSQKKAREITPWIMAEAVATDGRQSLEGLGILSIYMEKPDNWLLPKPLLDLGLNEDECWDLLQEIVKTLRLQGVVTMPEEVNPSDEIFSPRLGPIYVRENGSDPKSKILSWLPTKGVNKRLDYLKRVLNALGRFESDEKTREILKGIWGFLKQPDQNYSDYSWLASTIDPVNGAVYQLDQKQLRFKLIKDSDVGLFICSLCRKITTRSVRNVCPTLGCKGMLQVFEKQPKGNDDDHYRSIYLNMNPVSMTAKEHTAQWTNTEAASIQHKFIRGDINILSCSTTFELGVDVGELQSVFLRNMPPSTANYVQRAGRAGRRSGSAALVVTYANRRSHDLSIYNNPLNAMAGKIRTPFVTDSNERIDRRHAHSIVLSEFFRWYFDNYKLIIRKSHEFFYPTNNNSSAPADVLETFLSEVPVEIKSSLRAVLPTSVAEEIGVDNNAWVEKLLELVDIAKYEIHNSVKELDEQREKYASEKKYKLADMTDKIINNIRSRDILGYLGNKNILPKYGFPTDSVELRTSFTGDVAGSKVELSRDLSQAIYEYAPDSTLVAGGKLWTARGLYKMPGKELERFEYHTCDQCNGYWQARINIGNECPHCGANTNKQKRISVVPIYGFTADRTTSNPGPRPPQRSWSGATYVRKLPDTETTKYTLELVNGECTVMAGPRGEMSSISDGPGARGFVICEWCGAGASKMRYHSFLPQHTNPMTGRDCSGPSDSLDLSYNFQTDLCVLEFHLSGASKDYNGWLSLLYSIVESACEVLEIARQDIDGSLHPTGVSTWSVVLYDRVPGGAGNVLLIEKNVKAVLQAALKRVKGCDCGEETSCYRCLRSYDNQRYHDRLSRGDALRILEGMLR